MRLSYCELEFTTSQFRDLAQTAHRQILLLHNEKDSNLVVPTVASSSQISVI
jgi:hypothetical protein